MPQSLERYKDLIKKIQQDDTVEIRSYVWSGKLSPSMRINTPNYNTSRKTRLPVHDDWSQHEHHSDQLHQCREQYISLKAIKDGRIVGLIVVELVAAEFSRIKSPDEAAIVNWWTSATYNHRKGVLKSTALSLGATLLQLAELIVVVQGKKHVVAEASVDEDGLSCSLKTFERFGYRSIKEVINGHACIIVRKNLRSGKAA